LILKKKRFRDYLKTLFFYPESNKKARHNAGLSADQNV